jgi:hypothetical protein
VTATRISRIGILSTPFFLASCVDGHSQLMQDLLAF